MQLQSILIVQRRFGHAGPMLGRWHLIYAGLPLTPVRGGVSGGDPRHATEISFLRGQRLDYASSARTTTSH
jgi:hypothetical protein